MRRRGVGGGQRKESEKEENGKKILFFGLYSSQTLQLFLKS